MIILDIWENENVPNHQLVTNSHISSQEIPSPFSGARPHVRFCLRHEEGHEGATRGRIAGGMGGATLQNRHLHGLVLRYPTVIGAPWAPTKNAFFAIVS